MTWTNIIIKITAIQKNFNDDLEIIFCRIKAKNLVKLWIRKLFKRYTHSNYRLSTYNKIPLRDVHGSAALKKKKEFCRTFLGVLPSGTTQNPRKGSAWQGVRGKTSQTTFQYSAKNGSVSQKWFCIIKMVFPMDF